MSYKDMGVKLIGWRLRFQGRDDDAEFERRSPVGQGSTKGGQREGQEQWRGNRKGRQAALTQGLRSSPPECKGSSYRSFNELT